MSDVMLRFPACFTAGKCSLPSNGTDMTRYDNAVEKPVPADSPGLVTEKSSRPWLIASELSLMGEEDMA